MNELRQPIWWDDDDVLIAELLNSSPVPDTARQSVRRLLLARIGNLANNDSPLEPASLDKANEAIEMRELAQSQSLGSVASRALASAQTCVPPQAIETSQALPTRSSAAYGRRWLAISALAASVVLGLFWWSSNSQVSTDQLVAVCDELVTQNGKWEVADGDIDQSELQVLSESLSKYVTGNPSGTMETCVSSKNSIGSQVRLWKIPMERGSELYVLVFQSPRNIKNIDSRLNLLVGSSLGWSTAAVQTSEHLIVFMSKDDLKRTLRFMPLA